LRNGLVSWFPALGTARKMPADSSLPPWVTRVLLPMALLLVLAIFWQPQREILWNGSWVLKTCLKLPTQKSSSCIGQYELSIANTGKRSERVRVEWPLSLDGWSAEGRVLDLSADFRRANDPEYRCDWAAGHAACSIEEFAPGTLLVLNIHCFTCAWSELESLDQQAPVLVSEASVHRSDPRSTYLFRRLRLLLGLFT